MKQIKKRGKEVLKLKFMYHWSIVTKMKREKSENKDESLGNEQESNIISNGSTGISSRRGGGRITGAGYVFAALARKETPWVPRVLIDVAKHVRRAFRGDVVDVLGVWAGEISQCRATLLLRVVRAFALARQNCVVRELKTQRTF